MNGFYFVKVTSYIQVFYKKFDTNYFLDYLIKKILFYLFKS
jgi:hypothetical protein